MKKNKSICLFYKLCAYSPLAAIFVGTVRRQTDAVRSRWPNGLEQSPGFHQGPVSQHSLFQMFAEDVSVCAILLHAAH